MSDAHHRLMALGHNGALSAADCLEVRRIIFPDGIVSRSEIEALFALGERAPQGDPAWPALFAEVCADYFLNEEVPEGFLTDEEFAFLEQLVTRDGRCASALELGALIALLNRARGAPPAMARFIGDQILRLVCARSKPTITQADVALIQSYIYASGSEHHTGIGRAEADFLFDLHDATAGADNASGWQDLFVKALAAHLMQHLGYSPIDREGALRLNAWIDEPQGSAGAFFSRMVSGGLAAIRAAYEDESVWAERNRLAAAGAERAKTITGDEAAWLADRLGRNRQLDEAERALLVYLRDHLNADLPEPLAELAAMAAGDAKGAQRSDAAA